nr:MerC domain-containing protein [Bowmanella yangjiangensis]
MRLTVKDILGALASALCICHCLFTPLLVALGATGLLVDSLTTEWFHLVLFIPILLLLMISLPKAHCQHKSPAPLGMAVVGITLLVLSLFSHDELELIFSLGGGTSLIVAHLLNRHLLNKVRQLQPYHSASNKAC